MSERDDRPAVILSPVDAAYECVLAPDDLAAPPDGSTGGGTPLCPPGYVPRLRRRAPYDLDGKSVVSDRPAEENPGPR